MRVLISGGTGFIGGWTAKAIADAGHQVRFLVRDPARLTDGAGALGVDTSDYSVGDITDREAVARALKGCDAVVHSAAVVALDPGQAEEMIETNLAGARNVLGQAVDLGLDPIVYVSSNAAIFQRHLAQYHADLPVVGGTDAYGRSKARVEVYARGLQAMGAPVTITYPCMVIGPPAGHQFGEGAQGVEGVLNIGVVPGRKAAWTMIDVRDLGAAHAALLEPGHGPRRYMLGVHHLKLREVADLMRAASGRKVRVVPVPDGLLRGTGRVADRLRRFLPASADQFTEAGMQYYTEFPPADTAPAERDLGLTFRPASETIRATVEGLRTVGRG
ncbi:MAG TPA: NAD-dependent epimerase/dehydratase family protein [Nocardioidaceae bacterium]|nr:NAD-dependent epimerase/dehydratase family protein [Nocardioidaceae bacterium]